MAESNTEGKRSLYVVGYENDAERKRAEYLFNNWSDGEIERPDGLVRIAMGTDHDELYEQLVTKVPPNQVTSYHLKSAGSDVEPAKEVVIEQVDSSLEAVEDFLEYVLSKKGAVLQSDARNEYETYTSKGRVKLSYETTVVENAIQVRVHLAGYDSAPSYLANYFRTELAAYATSQTPDTND